MLPLAQARQAYEHILHFHPILAPFLRSQAGADDPATKEKYAEYYQALAGYLSVEDLRKPQPALARARRELPNLRRAVDLLLEAGDLDDASLLTDEIIRFLNVFGLERERDELRRRVDAAVALQQAQEDTLTSVEYTRGSAGAMRSIKEAIYVLPIHVSRRYWHVSRGCQKACRWAVVPMSIV